MDAVLEYCQGVKLSVGFRIPCVMTIKGLLCNYLQTKALLVTARYKSIWRKVISVVNFLSLSKRNK